MNEIEVREMQKRSEVHKNDIAALINERKELISKLHEAYDKCDEYGTLADKYEAKSTMTKIECDKLTARVNMLERAMYTADTQQYMEGHASCLFCKFSPEGTESASAYIPEFGWIEDENDEYDANYCNRCDDFSINERGGWEFDEKRFGSSDSKE